jgi:hypothetical protein
MYTISVEVQPLMYVNIHNQCSDFKLIELEYFNTGIDWYKYPALVIDAGKMMSVYSMYSLASFEGVLTYKLQRKSIKTNYQSESTCIRLFVAWRSEGYKNLCAFVHLIEYNEAFHWDTIRLEEYYQRYANYLSTYTDPIKDTWLTHDGTMLMTGLKMDFTQRDGRLNIIISESVKNDYTKIPVWIDLER